MLPFRLDTKPARQWLYLQLQRDGKLSKGTEIGLDLGCNRMRNYPIFRSQEYYGVDLDEAALDFGCARYPKAHPVHARIEDFNAYPDGDFVLCVQCMSTYHFDHANTLHILEGIVAKVRSGGTLIVNFGKTNAAHIRDARNLFHESFQSVVEKHPRCLSRRESVFTPLIATTAFYLPVRERERGNTYFCCSGRL